MEIVPAVSTLTILEAALVYAQFGISVLPLDGKNPPSILTGGQLKRMSWLQRQQERASVSMIHYWDDRGWWNNVGIVCGRVSGNLVVLDLDGLSAVVVYKRKFPELLNTHAVLTGSGRGMHLYYRVVDMPPTMRATAIPDVGNIELRSEGCYVVAPPSVHPDTHQRYRVEQARPILEVPNLDDVQTWMRDLLPHKPLSFRAPIQMPSEKTGRAIRFAEAALTSEICAVRSAVTGNRNNLLNRASYSLGQLIADGLLSHDRVESVLLSAALDAGLSEAEASRTIQSGLRAGLRNPRSRRHG